MVYAPCGIYAEARRMGEAFVASGIDATRIICHSVRKIAEKQSAPCAGWVQPKSISRNS